MQRSGFLLSTALLAGSAFLGAGACSSLQDVVRAKDDGTGSAQIYPVNEQQAWRITNTILSLKSSNPPPHESRGEGYVLQTVQVSPLSPGVFLGVWVESVGPDRTKVTFVRKRRGATETVRALTDREFHHDFAALVALASCSCADGGEPVRGSCGAANPISSAQPHEGGSLPASAASDSPMPPPAPPSADLPGAPSVSSSPMPASSGTSNRKEASVPSSVPTRNDVSAPAVSASASASSPKVREIPLPPRRVR